MKDIQILAVGEIDHKNMDEYLQAGDCCVGVGSNIALRKLIDERDSESLIEHMKMYIR